MIFLLTDGLKRIEYYDIFDADNNPAKMESYEALYSLAELRNVLSNIKDINQGYFIF